MHFNLSNEEYYCQYWRKHFEDIFLKLGFQKTSNKKDVEIGHYNFATKIAYGFPNCYARKKMIHLIFREEPYYPKSMLITKKWAIQNAEKLFMFLDGERKVLKNNHGVGSKSIKLVYSLEDCVNYMNSKDFYVLQTEIEPLLFQGHKLDERVYYLVVKEDNLFSGYLFKEGHIKLAGFKFDSVSKDMGVFATNIKAPKPEGSDGADFTLETNDFLKRSENKIIWKKNRLELMKKISEKYLPVVAKLTKSYYKNKKEPKFMWHMYGIDILIDKEYNMYLCEFNGKPGVIYDDVMPKMVTNKNRVMCNRIARSFLGPWLSGKINRYEEDPTIIKLGEYST